LSGLIVGEFVAIAANPNYGRIYNVDINKALTNYQGFICGFERRLILGAELMFGELYDAGYSVEYSNGFRDGYSQGYASGWQAGYNAGYKAGSTQSTWVSSLTTILGDVGSIAGSAATILKGAGTAETFLALIF
jgi:hypothetical protein